MKKDWISYIKRIFLLLLFFSLFLLTNKDASASADNSLSRLGIEGVQLSPEFKYSRLKYSGTVDYSVTDVQIDAVTSNKAAKIISISGNTNLQVGENIISVVVEAKNGRKATYTIRLVRNAASDSDVTESTETSAGPEGVKKPKKSETEKLKAKIKKKNKKIEELNQTITELNSEMTETRTQYDKVMKENQKIYAQRIIMIISIVLLFCALLLSLFIGVIRKSTGKYVTQEFGDEMPPHNIPFHPFAPSEPKSKRKKSEDLSDNEEYGFMKRPSNRKRDDSLFSNIEEVIQSELGSQKEDSKDLDFQATIELPKTTGINSMNLDSVSLSNALNNTPEATDEKDKDEEFSFDIIEI